MTAKNEPKPEFQPGDTVEILNTTTYQRWNLGEAGASKIIGMKFKITKVWHNESEPNKYFIQTETTREVTGNRRIEMCFEADQLLIYNRPVRSWFKRVFKIKK